MQIDGGEVNATLHIYHTSIWLSSRIAGVRLQIEGTGRED